MSQTVSVSDVEINGFMLSVTTRMNTGDTPSMLEDLTANTIVAWLWMANLIENNQWDASKPIDSVETRYAKEHNITIPETFGDSRVTVWDTWRSQQRIGFTLNSDDLPQDAVSVHYAHVAGIKKAVAKWNEAHPYNTPEFKQEAANILSFPYQGANTSTSPQNAPNTPNLPQVPVEGVIVANRAPNKNRQYPDGQLVKFDINKIVMGTNKGSITYSLWGDLGKNYALKTIYKTKNNSDENSPDYIAAKDVLVSLGLSVDAGKIEASGKWALVCKVVHGKNGKGEETEYFNVQSLTAV